MRSILNSASEIGAPRPDEISRLSASRDDRREAATRRLWSGKLSKRLQGVPPRRSSLNADLGGRKGARTRKLWSAKRNSRRLLHALKRRNASLDALREVKIERLWRERQKKHG